MRDPAFLFYDGDAARDVSHMNRLERGAYFDMIQAQRKFHGITTEQARKILGKDYDGVWPALELVLAKDDLGQYYIEWLSESIRKRREFSEKQRTRITEYWDKKKKNTVIPRNNHGTTTEVPCVNENENVIEDVIDNENANTKTWRNDYETYLKDCEAGFDALYNNWEWIAEQRAFYPGLVIQRCLDKMYRQFWGTEAGWKHKKAKKAKDLNWKRTIENGLSMANNKCWLGKNEQDFEEAQLKAMGLL